MPAGNPEPRADCVAAGNMNPERVAKTQELNHDDFDRDRHVPPSRRDYGFFKLVLEAIQ
jgi:hypothetical protein